MARSKLVHVRISVPDREALEALPLDQMDRGCTGGVKRRADGSLAFEATVLESTLKAITAKGIKVEVVGDPLEESRKRQKEVGRGNRFAGDEWVPRGRGRKIREGER